MTKSSPFWASCLIPTLTAALFTVSCAGGETTNSGPTGGTVGSTGGSTGGTASGGRIGSGSGGSNTGSGSGGSNTGSGSGGSNTGSGSGGSNTGSGSGGSNTGSGSGGSVGTGTGGATTAGGALTITAGYVTNGTYKGYAYSFTGPATGSKATIMPATYTAATTFCATGAIAIDSTYASVAGMGMNVNQAVGTTATPPPIETVATTGTGLMVNVSATGITLVAGGSQLRAQIKTAGGDYCAPLAASGTSMIPWGMFDKTCWDTTAAGHGAFTAGGAISAVELIIPSGAAAIASYNICLLDAKPY